MEPYQSENDDENDDESEIDIYFRHSDYGFATLYLLNNNDCMKIIESKGNGYLWDNQKKRWVKSNSKIIR